MRPLLIIIALATGACGPDTDGPPPVIEPPAKLDDGAGCRTAYECEGGACYAAFFGFPGGHCTTPNCETDTDCNGDAKCLTFVDDTSACFASCTDGCREGYACTESGESTVCSPTNVDLDSIVLTPNAPFEDTLAALDADCAPLDIGQNRYTFSFEVSENADSFMFVPFVPTGDVAFSRLVTPSRSLTRHEYRHHNTRLEDIGVPSREPFGTFGTVSFDWPVLVPFAPQFEDLLQGSGTYGVEVKTTGAVPCMYIVEGEAGGTQVDLDIYLVTSNGPNAAEARQSEDFAAALDIASSHLTEAGIGLGDVRFYDASPEVSERFSVVRDVHEVDLLTATGAPRGPTLQEHLVVDVFIVDTIIFDGITALGISAGVPGPAGMHGNLSNGLVFSAPDLGFENETVGQVLAHELSHYLGLRHTTEVLHGTGSDFESELNAAMGTTDPIADTPECSSVQRLGSSCPDYTNLMFPVIQALSDGQSLRLTPGQSTTLRRSPLVKVATDDGT